MNFYIVQIRENIDIDSISNLTKAICISIENSYRERFKIYIHIKVVLVFKNVGLLALSFGEVKFCRCCGHSYKTKRSVN